MDDRTFRRLQSQDWFLGDTKILQFFEVRHRGVELWKKVRNNFQNKSQKGLKEVMEEEALHKGFNSSQKIREFNWTIHPYSLTKFIIYFFKLLSLLYNFFYIPVM